MISEVIFSMLYCFDSDYGSIDFFILKLINECCLVGFYWLVHCVFGLKKCKPTYPVSPVGLTYISAFSLMSLLYGPVHLMRIVKQKHTWAVLDQV